MRAVHEYAHPREGTEYHEYGAVHHRAPVSHLLVRGIEHEIQQQTGSACSTITSSLIEIWPECREDISLSKVRIFMLIQLPQAMHESPHLHIYGVNRSFQLVFVCRLHRHFAVALPRR